MVHDLAALIAPVEVGEFFSQYWELKPLYVRRRLPSHYAGLFSLDDVDGILTNLSRQSRSSRARLVLDGSWIPAGDRFDLVFVLRTLAEGATLLIEGVEHDSPEILSLCRNLEETFGGRVGVNLYLTPTDAQGFATHFDYHDVIVLQISGTKEWYITDGPIHLPRAGMVDGSMHETASGRAIPLRAGDALYLPRGFVHTARTQRGHSLHLTVGLHTVTWVDVVGSALAEVAKKDERFRRSVPGMLISGRASSSAEATHYQELLKVLAERSSLTEALHALQDERPLPAVPRMRDILAP